MERTRLDTTAAKMPLLVLLAFGLAGCWRDVNPLMIADVASAVDDAVLATDATSGCALPDDGGICPRGFTCTVDCSGCTCSLSGVLSCIHLELCREPDAGPPSCTTNADCPTGDVCAYPQPGCTVRGVCQTIEACNPPVGFDYCGCDGMSHPRPTCNLPPMPYTSLGPCPGSNCNPGSVRCDRAPRLCPAGLVASVGPSGCWSGLCVPYADCACGPTDPCPGSFYCSSGTCEPPRP